MPSLFGRNISFSSFMAITFEIVHTCVSVQNTNGYEVLSDSHKYFTFVSHISSLILISMISLIIPHLAVIFVFPCMTFLLQFINILHLVDIFVFHINDKLMYSLSGRHIYLYTLNPV